VLLDLAVALGLIDSAGFSGGILSGAVGETAAEEPVSAAYTPEFETRKTFAQRGKISSENIVAKRG
jgi:hypothetical protein